MRRTRRRRLRVNGSVCDEREGKTIIERGSPRGSDVKNCRVEGEMKENGRVFAVEGWGKEGLEERRGTVVNMRNLEKRMKELKCAQVHGTRI